MLENGIVPWAVGEVVTTLTQQFQDQQWSAAATTIADLCHYVGDACQPLHCTRNYDGQFTGNNGIHSRYETTMMSSHIGELTTPVTPVTYYPNPVDAMFEFVDDSRAECERGPRGRCIPPERLPAVRSTLSTMPRCGAAREPDAEPRDQCCRRGDSVVRLHRVEQRGRPQVPGSTVDVPSAHASGSYLVAGPTPFRDALSIQYAGAGPLSVEVLDVRGARVEQIVDRGSSTGTVSWRPSRQMAPGIYFIRLTGSKDSIVRRASFGSS